MLSLLVSWFTSCTRPHLEPRAGRPPLPALEELDAWLAERERSVPGLRRGVEAGVVWAHPDSPSRTRLSLVYLPGYSATRGEISPVAEQIAAALGANLYFARPTGQGGDPDGHRTVTAADWVADGLEAWNIGQLLGEKVILVGVSTGATLATWLTLGPQGIRPAASIFISPNLTPKNRQTEWLLWPGNEWLLQQVLGQTMSSPPGNAEQALYWDNTHHSHSLIPMMQLVEGARSRDFSRWPTPVLVVFNPTDPVVDQAVTVERFSRVDAQKRRLVPWEVSEGDDQHVLAGRARSPAGTERMVEVAVAFLTEVLAEATSP